MSYLSRPAIWTYGGVYSGGYSQYFRKTDLSGYFQNSGAWLNYDDGGPLSATLNVGLGFGSGANRYYQDFVEQLSLNYGISARYAISQKASVAGSFSQSLTSARDSTYSDTSSFNIGTSLLWRYSPVLEFGPGVRYTYRSGEHGDDRTSIGPTLTVNYVLNSVISMNSQVGMDFSDNGSGGSSDPSFSTSMGLNYHPSELWGLNLSLYRDMQADPAIDGGFTEITALNLGYYRKVRRAMLNLGVGYEINNPETNRFTRGTKGDLDFFTLNASLSMPIFSNTCNASVFMRYQDQSSDSSDSWDSYQAGFSISHSF